MGGVLTGGKTRVNIQFEDPDNYGSVDSNRDPFVPGANATLDTREATNNGRRITLPASRKSVAIKAGSFDGAWSISGALTNPWIYEALLGSPSTTDNGDGTYTHTYDLGDPVPFQILEGYELSTTAEATLEGCLPARIAVNPSVGEDGVVPFTAEGFYRKETLQSSVSLTSQDTLDNDPWDYADARLDVDTTTQAIVQNASVELAVNPLEAVQEFGSRFPSYYLAGLYEPALNHGKLKADTNAQQRIYGGSTSMQEDVPDDTTFTMEFDNGAAAGSGQNMITYNGSGGFGESYGEDGPGNPRAAIQENLQYSLQDVQVVATNETQSPP